MGAVGDDRIPAIVGAAQVVQRPGDWADLADARGPIELMVDAAREAAIDAGAPGLLEKVQWVAVAGGWWRYRNPGQVVAAQLGSPDAATCLTLISGSAPQDLVAIASERIARGELDVALVLGGEARWSTQRLKRAGEEPRWNADPGVGEPEVVGGFPPEMTAEARVFGAAATAYALFDDSLRIARGDSMDAQRDRIAALWAGYSAVAAGNPYAWDRVPKSAAQIRDATPDNRMISFPYTKAMVANNTVDMASAVLICSRRVARDAGVPDDQLVYPHVGTSSHETWLVANRNVLHETPALQAAGRAAFELAGVGPEDIAHVDLYGCFPAIVQMSAAALGLGTERPLTVTGGLGFAGAPVGNSTGQAIAAMTHAVRAGGWGLVHGNGGNATKHAFGLYSTTPPETFVRVDCQDRADLRPRESVDDDWSGEGLVEAATVVYDRDGPSHVMAAVRTNDDARALVRSADADVIAQAMSTGLGGVATPLP